MSAKEVTDLRKQGRLKEAFELAKSNLENYPEDIWNKRVISWVYYEYLKNAVAKNSRNDFIAEIENISNLNLPETERYIFDSVAWQVGKFLFANEKIDTLFLDVIFSNIKEFSFSKPSDAYSFILKAFKKHSQEWISFIDFTRWWNLDNFQETDYVNFVLDNGKSIPSLVESTYIAISKSLLSYPINEEDILKFTPKIAEVSVKYKNMQYPPYYYAKLLIVLGDRENFMEAFLPFAKRKNRDFWVWNLMSENFDKGTDEYFSCLCKSATCGAPDKFTGDVREKLAHVFIAKEKYKEAKFELQKIIDSRVKEGWTLRDKHISWQNFAWWNNTDDIKNNFNIYNTNLSLAESLLFSDIPEDIVVVERVNKEKLVFNFVISKEQYGFASFRNFKIKPKIGDVFAVRFDKKTDDKSSFYKILSIVNGKKHPSKEVYRKVIGNLKLREGNSFGFLENIFMSPQIIKENNFLNNDTIQAIAINTYNKKRKAFGWNIIKIIK